MDLKVRFMHKNDDISIEDFYQPVAIDIQQLSLVLLLV